MELNFTKILTCIFSDCISLVWQILYTDTQKIIDNFFVIKNIKQKKFISHHTQTGKADTPHCHHR